MRIDVELVRPGPGPRNGNSETRYRVIHEGREIGVWRAPMCAAARWLIAEGIAQRDDVLSMWRGDVRCMVGAVGWLADRTVSESDAHDGTPRFAKFNPFPDQTLPAMQRVLAGRLLETSQVD